IAGIADGWFADGAGFECGVDGDAHVVDGIERVEDAEDVDALRVGFADKFLDYVIRIGSVAYRVRAAEEHLEADVGDALAEFAEALPGIFVEEAEGGVERRSTPHFEAEEIGETLGDGGGGGENVEGADAGGHQRLVRVAESGVGE